MVSPNPEFAAMEVLISDMSPNFSTIRHKNPLFTHPVGRGGGKLFWEDGPKKNRASHRERCNNTRPEKNPLYTPGQD